MWGIYRYAYNNELVQVVIGSVFDADEVCKGWNIADASFGYYVSEIKG